MPATDAARTGCQQLVYSIPPSHVTSSASLQLGELLALTEEPMIGAVNRLTSGVIRRMDYREIQAEQLYLQEDVGRMGETGTCGAREADFVSLEGPLDGVRFSVRRGRRVVAAYALAPAQSLGLASVRSRPSASSSRECQAALE